MISVKKAFFAVCFGLGLAVSLHAWAAPSEETCEAMAASCRAGDTASCDRFHALPCEELYGIVI